jgi:hypothetical protein
MEGIALQAIYDARTDTLSTIPERGGFGAREFETVG